MATYAEPYYPQTYSQPPPPTQANPSAFVPQAPYAQQQHIPPPGAPSSALVPHSQYPQNTSQSLQPVPQPQYYQQQQFYPEQPPYGRTESHKSHRSHKSHHSHHRHDEDDYERDRDLERRSTWGGVIMEMIYGIKDLLSSKRH